MIDGADAMEDGLSPIAAAAAIPAELLNSPSSRADDGAAGVLHCGADATDLGADGEEGGDARAASTAAASCCDRNTTWPETVRRTVLRDRSRGAAALARAGKGRGLLGFFALRGGGAGGEEDGKGVEATRSAEY